MEILTQYGVFLLETVTIVAAVLVILITLARVLRSGPEEREGTLQVKKLKKRYERLSWAIQEKTLSPEAYKAKAKEEKKKAKRASKEKGSTEEDKKVYVLDFQGDLRASAVENLRQEVTALLRVVNPQDEVVLCLESSGGLVHSYGLAASQLARLKGRTAKLTVCVDRVAASGGYLMACVADTIVSAPFAIVGSIGVVATVPNFHRFLEKRDINVEQITAGEFKRTLTLFGRNTDDGRTKFTQQLEETHALFKDYLARHRPQLDLEKVATGEHWLGSQAKDLALVDEIKTSDDVLLEAAEHADLIHLRYKPSRSISGRLQRFLTKAFRGAATSALEATQRSPHDL